MVTFFAQSFAERTRRAYRCARVGRKSSAPVTNGPVQDGGHDVVIKREPREAPMSVVCKLAIPRFGNALRGDVECPLARKVRQKIFSLSLSRSARRAKWCQSRWVS